jgi:hypothetical protein
MDTSTDRQRAARSLADQFQGVHAWYGEHTHEWWAMVPLPAGPRLLSAPDIQQLRQAIANAQAWPWHHP